MELTKKLGVQKNCIVSIVGAGGKSTLMYTLADELRNNNKVLVTTSTKIFLPDKSQFDYIAIGNDSLNLLKQSNNNGTYVYGNAVNAEKKLIGSDLDLNRQLAYFDYILVEADGANRKIIKGWNENEPVISKDTTMTIGVLNIESFGKKINEDDVHRIKEFMEMTDTKENEVITVNNLVSLIFHQNGLFKHSVGDRVLFINQVECSEKMEIAKQVLNEIIGENKRHPLINQVIIGSLKNKYYRDFNMRK